MTSAAKHPQIPQPKPQQQQQQVVVTAQQVKAWSGPLPSPADLEKFNQIIPNGADRIVKMAEQEQAHRIQYEQVGLPATIRESRRGQYLGALISLAAIGGAIFTAYIGAHPSVPIALVSVTILGIVRAIVRPRGNGDSA